MKFRTLDFFPNSSRPSGPNLIGDPSAVTQIGETFRGALVAHDVFRTPEIKVYGLDSIFCQFQRIEQTAGFACWTQYQPNDAVETIRRGFDVFTLLLSGVSESADGKVIRMFEELVTAPVLQTPEFKTQDYKVPAEFVGMLREQKLPVGVTIYLRPKIIETTGVSSAPRRSWVHSLVCSGRSTRDRLLLLAFT